MQHKYFKVIITDGEYEVLIQTPSAHDAENGAEIEVIIYHDDYDENFTLTIKDFYNMFYHAQAMQVSHWY